MRDKDAEPRPHAPREHERVSLDAFVRVVDLGSADREYAFRTRDLSEGGLFLYTRVGHLYPFSVGSSLDIELHDGARVLSLHGRVVRIVEPGSHEAEHYPVGFGVQLDAIDEPARAALRALTASE